MQILNNYFSLFPEVFECIATQIKKEKGTKGGHNHKKWKFNTVKDVFPSESFEAGLKRIQTISKWIEGLPTSKLPFVDIGFDTLNKEMISRV